jgi:O-acetyl-ADP-ribose deacetylase (regulator of RNase III)
MHPLLEFNIMEVKIIKGDITEISADAIVNAANSLLMGGGGVDGAIHRVAGPKLLEECKEVREKRYPDGLPVGQAVITEGYDLPAKFVIHTVGPRYHKEKLDLLVDCYLNSLKLAEKNKCKAVLFPAISTGAYGVPIELSAQVVKNIFQNYSSSTIEDVGLVLFSDEDCEVYRKEFGK